MRDKPAHASDEDWRQCLAEQEVMAAHVAGIMTIEAAEWQMLNSSKPDWFLESWRGLIETTLEGFKDCPWDDLSPETRRTEIGNRKRLAADLAYLDQHYPA
jgi:hypothetical protein